MSIIGTVYEDVTTDVLGQMGAWQWMVTMVSTALMTSTMFIQFEDMFFLKYTSDIECIPPDGYESSNSSACHVISTNSSEQLQCKAWNVRLMGVIWIKKNWIITCDHDWKLLSTAMVCRLGVMFGYVGYGLIADSFGRKKAMVLDVCANIILRLAIVFCDSESWFKLLVFIRSLLGSANSFMGLILISEVASNRWRSRLMLVAASPRLIASVCMVPLAQTVPNSETFTMIACLYDVLLMFFLRWTPESPQWLLFNNKISRAESMLYMAANKNSKRLCSDFKIRPVNHRAYYCLDENQTCIEVLSTHNTRVLTLVALSFWILNCNSWSMLYATVYSEEQSNYFLLNILCFTCIIGCLTIFLSLKWKLRHLLMFNIFISGVSGAAVLIFRHAGDTASSLLYSFTLAARIIGLAILLMIAPRLFATNIRATLVGCCHSAGQLGAIIGYLVTTTKLMSAVAQALLGVVLTVVLMIMCLIFPDVDNRELPDVLQDMDYFSELSKPLRWATQKTHSPSREEVELRTHSFGSKGRALQSHSGSLPSLARAPAQPIGFRMLWRMLANTVRRCFNSMYCKNKE